MREHGRGIAIRLYCVCDMVLWKYGYETTLELPDGLMRALKVRAAQSDRKLKDLVAELIERGLEAPQPANRIDPLQAGWKSLL